MLLQRFGINFRLFLFENVKCVIGEKTWGQTSLESLLTKVKIPLENQDAVKG